MVMPYRASHIEKFIDDVKKEADEAAQAIYEKNQSKLNELISNQVLKGQRLIMGNGAVLITGSPNDDELPYNYASKFNNVLTNMQYETGFSTINVDKRKLK